MKVNLFFEGVDSKYGYQSSLLKKIDEQINFQRCVMTEKKHDDLDIYGDKYIRINYDICEHNEYDKICDFNDIMPLSREVLEKMLPYESTAMKMLIRNMEIDVYTYEEAKRLYLRHLRFWNHMFIENEINFVVLNCTPHHTHVYIIYALAKINNIGLSVNIVTNIKNWWFTGKDIIDVGKKVSQQYYSMLKEKETVVLPKQVEEYYQALIYREDNYKNKAVYGGKDAMQMKKSQNDTFWSYAGKRNSYIRNWKKLKYGIKKSFLEKDMKPLSNAATNIKEDIYYLKRIKLRMKKMVHIKTYDSKAEIPDYNEKYIVYYLHYQPEGTTLPQAGVFVEQEIVLEILSKSLEGTGIKLYVKEHFVQLYRNQSFYNDIKKIRNVKLIKSTVDSKKLMMNSIATSACNGTIILESIANGKPTLVFSLGGFSDGPGIFPVNSVEECKDAIENICNSKAQFSAEQVRKYFKAFAEQAVYAETFWNRCDADEEKIRKSIESNTNRIVYAINEYVQKG